VRVFLSGTQDDLQPERDAVEAAVAGRGFQAIRAETMPAQAWPSREAILKAVSYSDIYVGVYGRRYGWIVPDRGISATELEFEEAQQLGKPTLVYVKASDAPEPAQKAFLQRVQDFDAGYFRRPRFTSPAQLAEWIAEDLGTLVGDLVRDPGRLRRRQLHRAYAVEVHRRFEWRVHYVPLAARGARRPSPPVVADALDAPRTPGTFLPRGFRVRSPRRPRRESAPEEQSNDVRFDDVLKAIAEAGDAVLLGEPGAGKTTSLWQVMLDCAEQTLQDRAARLPILVPLGGFDERTEVLELVRRELSEASSAARTAVRAPCRLIAGWPDSSMRSWGGRARAPVRWPQRGAA